jgi:hypothetical protein
MIPHFGLIYQNMAIMGNLKYLLLISANQKQELLVSSMFFGQIKTILGITID